MLGKNILRIILGSKLKIFKNSRQKIRYSYKKSVELAMEG